MEWVSRVSQFLEQLSSLLWRHKASLIFVSFVTSQSFFDLKEPFCIQTIQQRSFATSRKKLFHSNLTQGKLQSNGTFKNHHRFSTSPLPTPSKLIVLFYISISPNTQYIKRKMTRSNHFILLIITTFIIVANHSVLRRKNAIFAENRQEQNEERTSASMIDAAPQLLPTDLIYDPSRNTVPIVNEEYKVIFFHIWEGGFLTSSLERPHGIFRIFKL